MKRTAMLGLLALVSLAGQANADEPVFRVGAAATFGNFEGKDVIVPSLGNKFIDDSSTGIKLYGQYQFSKWLGVEGAYHNTGQFEDTSASESLPGTLELTFSGFSAQALLFIPIPAEGLSAYVKYGFYDFDDDLGVDGNSLSSSSETGAVYGGGAVIDIGDNLAIRADLDVFDADVGDLLTVNLGLQYSFGGPKDGGK